MPEPFLLLPAGALAGRAAGDEVRLPDDVDHHVRTVRRLGPGDAVELADGAGVTAAAQLTHDAAVLAAAPTTVPELLPRLHLIQALPKGRAMEEVVRAATELGVATIMPVATDRAVRELAGDRADKVLDRWRRIVRAACEQSRRPRLPAIAPVRDVDAVIAGLDGELATAPLVAAHVGASVSLRAVLADLGDAGGAPVADVVLAVGPEGGFSEREAALLAGRGALASLGPSVLRTEHAGLALLAMTHYALRLKE